jgi:UDP-N-acetylmuramoyl-tripeptide--D-alanyl-D-alanine ligase
MGAYRIGEIKRICNIVHPKYGVLTAIGNQHISLFGSKENIKKAKTELLEALQPDGKAFVNAAIEDHDFIMGKTKCALTWYSADDKSDIYADAITHVADGLTAQIHYKEHSFTIQTKLIGRHNVENLLPAIGLGIDLGISTETIQKAISELENLDFKLSLSNGINGATILNDAKNSNVEGFIEAIKTAKQFPHQKKHIISKGIIELGLEKGESYERIISALNDVGMILVTTDSLFKKIHPEENIIVLNNESEILNYIQEKADKNTLIIIEGKFTKGFVQALVIPSDNEGSH